VHSALRLRQGSFTPKGNPPLLLSTLNSRKLGLLPVKSISRPQKQRSKPKNLKIRRISPLGNLRGSLTPKSIRLGRSGLQQCLAGCMGWCEGAVAREGCFLLARRGVHPWSGPAFVLGGVVWHAGAKMTTTLAVPTNEEPDADVQTEGSNLTPRE
jgi:hypothetical protein